MQDFRGIDPSKDKLLQWWHSVNPADIKISLDENSEPVMREATADGDQARPDHQRPHAGTPPLAAKRVRDDSRENVTDPAQAGRSYMDEVANPIAADATVARLNAEVNDLAQRVAAAETGDAAQAEAVMRALEQRQDELRRAVARVVESNPEKLRLESRLGALEEALHNEPVLRGLDENLLRAQITEAKAELAAVMARLEEQANFLTGGEPPIDETKAGDEFRYGPQVPALWKPVGWTRFFKGASDILLATPGLEFLGRAVKRHVDLARKHQGHHTAPFLAWQRKFNRKERRQGFKDFEAYFTEVDAPVIERTAGGGTRKRGKTAAERAAVSAEGYSPAGRELIKRWQDGALAMHQKNRAVKLVVWDGQEQRFRPIGTIANYFPRTLKPEIRRVLQDPTSNKKLFDKITTELLNGGFIKRAEDALKFLSARFSGESSFDYFANIEAGRETPLPTMMYDYSFNAARRYLMSWCERVAQVEAYGQKVGAQGKDLFDIAQSGTYNQATKEYIEAVRQRAYGVTSKGVWARGAAVLNALATATQLSNPITVLTNLTSGLAYNATTIGFIPAVKGAWQMRGMMRDASIIAEAGEHGAILDDLMNMVSDMEALDSPAVNAAQQVAQFGLKWSGFNASERFVRTHSYLTAKSFLRDALKSWGGDTNHQSRRARLYEAWFERNGFDVDALRMENGTGEETGRFLRGAVNLAQGGYRFDQVPVFMDTPAGRFFFKYQKWGTQMAANFVRNAWNPAFNPGKDRNGQARPRDVMPLIGYLIITAALGAGLDELYEKIFGRAKRGASWSEIGNTLDDDALKALGMVASKIFQQQLVCGAYGAFGNYAQSMQDFAARSKFKSPLDPPGLATVKNVGELVMRLWEQDGRLTAADIDDIMAGQARAYATGKAALARALSVADADIAWQQNELARQDAAWLNSVTRRYADELGVQNRRMGFTRIGKTPQSRHYDAVHRALLRGDGEAARAAVVEYLAGYADSAARQTALKSLAASVRGRQPVKVGGSAGYEREQLFLEWAQKNLAPADVARIQEINRRYKETATRMGLMKPGGNMPLSPRQLREAERRINWRTRTSSYRTVPEQPAALAAQLRLVADGRKPALLVPKGTPDTVRENALALGLREAVTVAGTFYYNPDQVKRTELRRAALNNTIGEVLGYGIAAKPDERDAIGAVTVRGPDGAEKFSVATDRKNLTKVARAAGRLVDDGDVVDLEPVPAVLARRLAFPSREGVGAERTG